ncbi:binding-protein-dependent transport system inner membrane protein [Halovivax asiaticus JCM 14624]|uniref:Binding-protein-dependent transport system inner membrane protein n=1 Tax=Halovivax asiaticus JCM 14624 TaxID=1227490 RepID=M0BUL8_9EURY|nr:ABC transporter permease [Halovivax asiaticus]ELZ13812.1 binding-protein-dependent transport system inner membrane protein [Halovivax asiaticus JCM 14624]
MSTDPSRHRFEDVDWNEIERTRSLVTSQRLIFVVGLVVLFAMYTYDSYTGLYFLGTWEVETLDWLVFAGLVFIGSFVGVPLVRHGARTKQIVRRIVSRPAHAIAMGFLSLLAFSGIVGPAIYGDVRISFGNQYNPPIGSTSKMGWANQCAGEVTTAADGFTRLCHGSMANPLGTNHRGQPMGYLLIEGASVAMDVVLFTLAFVVPLAAIVGIVAGFRGGRIDDLLMSYVDVQLCIPAILVFIMGYMYWNVSLLLLLVTFGLLSWGGIARIVRSETLQRREDGYVLVARSLGASAPYIGRRHIIPNITNTLVPAVFHLLALFVLVEAGIAFLGFHHIETYSWGSTIQEGLTLSVSTGQSYVDPPATSSKLWWVSTLPAIALTITLVSLKLSGDALRDALDPRQTN